MVHVVLKTTALIEIPAFPVNFMFSNVNTHQEGMEIFVSSAGSASNIPVQNLQMFLPGKFIEKIESFRIKNCLAVTRSLENQKKIHCCQNCLNAHALKIAREMGIESSLLPYFDFIFPGEVGHEGYYLDEDNLIKV